MDKDANTVQIDDDENLIRNVFNRDYYVRLNASSEKYPGGPIRHYLEVGGLKSADPNMNFSSRGYLASNPDVAKSGMNPLVHYLRFGMAEGRMGHYKGHDAASTLFTNTEDFARKLTYLNGEDLLKVGRSIAEMANTCSVAMK